MARWELTVGDQSRYFLIATLNERNVAASGDVYMPSLLLPFVWEEILANGAQRDARGRVMAVALILHRPGAPFQYWVRTGLTPVTRAAEQPLLPLSHALIEELSRAAQARPEGEVVLEVSIQVLASAQEQPTTLHIHWHQQPQPVTIDAPKWQTMLRQWGYPAMRLVPLYTELPQGIGDSNDAARTAWTAACSHLRLAHEQWIAGHVMDAGKELREAVQLAIFTWGVLWYPDNPPKATDRWWEIARRLGEGIHGCDAKEWTIRPNASTDAQRVFSILMLLRNLNTRRGSYRDAVRARESRLADVRAGRFGWERQRKPMTLGEFVEHHWRSEVAPSFKPSTLRTYDGLLAHHLLPAFGEYPLPAITRAAAKRFIAEKSRELRWSYSRKNPNPNRPRLSVKTIKNAMGLLVSIMESAAADYNLVEGNPLRGMLRRRQYPTDARNLRGHRLRVLEPELFTRAVAALEPPVLNAVLVAALTGLRWGEQVALRMDEDIDFRRNKLSVTRALYRRSPQTPKTEMSVRSIDLCPTVRRILQTIAVERSAGLVFSPDGVALIGDGSWIKRQWRAAQRRAGIKAPITWHDLRHQFVSLLICAGKHPKYIAQQAGHSSAGITLDRYGTLFETLPITPVEWWDDLLWPSGHHRATVVDASGQRKAGERGFERAPEIQVGSGRQE